MTNYRRAFFLTAAGNLILLGLLFGAWWYSRGSHSSQQAAKTVASSAMQSNQTSAPSSPATPPSETPLAPVQISAERLQSIGVKFGVVERRSVEDDVRTTGTVAIDETRQSYVQTRFSGFIQKVFIDAAYKYVQQGQPLFTIYSPELAAAEREYLVARQNAKNLSQSPVPGVAAGSTSLVNASLDRLKQWNLPQREIERLETSGQVQEALEIDSPASGYVTERNALPNLTVQPDTRLYTIADLSTVWVFAQVFQNDLSRIRLGDPTALTVNSYPGRIFQGRVDFIYPDVDMNTRTARVRLVFQNPSLSLKPGMYVNVSVKVPFGVQLVIPASGVLQSGTRQIAFVDASGGYLEPRDVQLGSQVGDDFIVLKGLKAGERIVTSANFLIDSESQLQAAIGSFTPPPPGAGASAAMNAPASQPAVQIEFTTEPPTPRKGTNLYRVKLMGADGAPVTGAQVSVRSYMAAMPQMGMAAINVVTQLNEKGGGIYEGQVTLDSGGTWQITITATKNGKVIATKQLSLNAEGGM